MKHRTKTALVVDDLLRFVVAGGAIATILVAPGMAKALDTPLRKYFNKFDKRKQQAELRRVLYYMKSQGLIATTTNDYEHGLLVTKKGKGRLEQASYDNLVIGSPEKWDKRWRIVFFDIPEQCRIGRRQLIHKLKLLGFIQLQRSVWVHPFPCRQEIELVTSTYNVQKYVSYIEASSIDNQIALEKRFKTLLTKK